MAAPLPLDGYIRVSRVGGREGESFISPDVQRQQIGRWAELRRVPIAEWHNDLDQTGGKLARPGLDALMARVRSKQTGGVAVARLDRLSRAGVGDALKLVEEIHDAGGQLAVVDLGIDPTTTFGEFAMTVMLALARMRRREIAENWAIAQERAVARGVHIASKTPTGYTRRDDGRLEPHAEWGPVVADLFRMRAGGASWRELADHLNRHGVVGPYGSPHWRTRAVTHIVANRAYLGEARSGRHVNKAGHEALIDPVTFDAAQRARGASVPRSAEPAVLAGLLRCAGCRYVLKPDTMTDRGGARLRLYRCRGEHASGSCPDRAAVLERVVLPQVEERFFGLAAELRAAGITQGVDLSRLEAAASEADADLVAYRDDERIAEVLGTDRYLEGLRARAERADAAVAALAEARGRSGGLPLHVDLHELWPDLTAGEKQKLLMAAFDCIILRSGRSLPIENRLLFLRRGDAPDDLPRRGRRGPLRPFAWPSDSPGAIGEAATKDL